MKQIDPSIRRLFPWALFLALALLFALGACDLAHAADMAEPKMTFCEKIKAYLMTHSEAEARAEAAARHLPQWIVRKAEKCIHD